MKKKIATVMAATMAVSGSVVSVSADTTTEKIVGSNRTDTAVRISKEGWKSAETVILVNDTAIPDALTATPLAYAKNAPILLTGKNGLNKATADEIKRLGAKDVIMIGGDAVLSANVEKDLKALNVKVDRIKGETREETALAIAKRLDGIMDVSEIAVVNGTTGLADAVSVAAAAAERNMPILLANPKKGLSAAEKFIKDEAIKASYVIGGTTALPEKLVYSLPGKQRIEGSNRNNTNAKVIEKFYGSKELNNIYLAKDGMGDSGQLIDALAVGALAAKNGAPVLIASRKLSDAQIDVINTKKIDTITQVGGNGNENAFNQLKDIEEVDVYEVGTVEELEEALKNANANDKIILKPNATITEDIIISTDKNVDIKVEGTVTGKVEITAPNGNVTNNSTSKPSTGGGTIVTPPAENTPDTGAVLNGKEYKNVNEAIAVAKDGETVTIYGTNTLDSQLEITKKIKIVGKKNATLKPNTGFATTGEVSNLVSIEGAEGVEITDVQVTEAPGFGIHVYNSKGVKLNSIKSNNCGKGGLLVNNSEVTADALETGANAWYGVNVDGEGSVFNLTNAEISEGIQVYAEKGTVNWETAHKYKEINSNGSEKGTIYSIRDREAFGGAIVKTEENGFIGKYYKDVKQGIESTPDNTEVEIYGQYEIDNIVINNENVTIKGSEYGTAKLTHKGNTVDNFITFNKKGKMENITISGAATGKSGLHIYCTEVELKDVTVEGCPGAGIVVNAGKLTGERITTKNNTWGGINIDQGSGLDSKKAEIDITWYISEGENHPIYCEDANPSKDKIKVSAKNNEKVYESEQFTDGNLTKTHWVLK